MTLALLGTLLLHPVAALQDPGAAASPPAVVAPAPSAPSGDAAPVATDTVAPDAAPAADATPAAPSAPAADAAPATAPSAPAAEAAAARADTVPAPPPAAPPAAAAAAATTPPAAAAATAALPPLTQGDTRVPAPRRGLPWVGLMLSAGVPDGAGLDLGLRPLSFLRAHAGLAYNGVTPGLRAGLTLVPFQSAVRPTLTLEAGRLPEGDATKLAARFGASLGTEAVLLQRVGYDFATAHLGLELGSARRFSFFLRGGLSYMRGSVHGAAEYAEAEAPDAGLERLGTPRYRLTLPTLKLGFLLYLG